MITLGSWPNWIQAIGTSLAFAVAAASYRRSVTVRREEQARLVYSKLTHHAHHDVGAQFELLPNQARIGNATDGRLIARLPGGRGTPCGIALVPLTQVTAVVHNGSKELIGPAKIQMVDRGRTLVYLDFAVVVEAVDPESDYVVDFTFSNPDYPSQPALGTTVVFRDAAGSWWRRHLTEPIEAVHDDPENASPTPTELAAYAANAVALGWEPSSKPKVPRRARWHRYWRKRRGKSPIP